MSIEDIVVASFPKEDQAMARDAFSLAKDLSSEAREQTMLVFLILIYGKLLDLS